MGIRGWTGSICAVALVAWLLGAAAVAQADTAITVDTTADVPGPGCSLQAAIAFANSPGTGNGCHAASTAPGTITITVPAGTYLLSKGQLDLTGTAPTVVDGAGTGSDGTTVTAAVAAPQRLFAVGGGSTLTLKGVKLTGGDPGIVSSSSTEDGVDGGAVLNQGSLTLDSDLVTGNHTSAGTCQSPCEPGVTSTGNGGSGGAIYNDGTGTLTVTDTTFTSNSTGGAATGATGITFGSPDPGGPGSDAGNGGSGGAIYSSGTLQISDSTFSGNSTGSGGDGGTGGNGGAGAGTCPSCQPGGTGGDGGDGGSAGMGGAIFSSSRPTGETDSSGTQAVAGQAKVTISTSTIADNSTGNGGNGGAGGTGGAAFSNGAPGNGGNGGNGGNAAPALLSTPASGGGVVIDTPQSTATIADTTISGNTTGDGGHGGNGGTSGSGGGATDGAGGNGGNGGSAGGLDMGTTDASRVFFLDLTNTTVADNSTGSGGILGIGSPSGSSGQDGNGGGMEVDENSAISAEQSTIAFNSSSGTGGGIYGADSAGVLLFASLVASNTAPSEGDCGPSAPYKDEGYNVYGGQTTGCPTGAPGSLTVSDADILPLANNGGPTHTVALESGSPAINAVPLDQCLVSTDERGLARPQGAACDAGAYEWAPPTISGGSVGVSSAGVIMLRAEINPDLSARDTTAYVRYGTSSSYGSQTSSKDLGRGSKPVAYSATLSGLKPEVTYYYEFVATNADGTTTSSGTFKFTHPHIRIVRARTSGSRLRLKLACSGGGTCKGGVILTTRAHHRAERVGRGRYRVSSGHAELVRIRLDRAGRRLLARRHRLLVTITAGESHRRVTFRR